MRTIGIASEFSKTTLPVLCKANRFSDFLESACRHRIAMTCHYLQKNTIYCNRLQNVGNFILSTHAYLLSACIITESISAAVRIAFFLNYFIPHCNSSLSVKQLCCKIPTLINCLSAYTNDAFINHLSTRLPRLRDHLTAGVGPLALTLVAI